MGGGKRSIIAYAMSIWTHRCIISCLTRRLLLSIDRVFMHTQEANRWLTAYIAHVYFALGYSFKIFLAQQPSTTSNTVALLMPGEMRRIAHATLRVLTRVGMPATKKSVSVEGTATPSSKPFIATNTRLSS